MQEIIKNQNVDELNLDEKYEKLIGYFKDLKKVAVAYSSGVDSTFLLYVAYEALGDDAIALTADTSYFPDRELDETKEFTKTLGVRHYMLKINGLEIDGFAENPANRCYICKKHLFNQMISFINKQGIEHLVEGSNLDDDGDYRPGLIAIAELGIKSPLRELGFTKAEIRKMSKKIGLYTADKPSFACLASRFPYGELITEKKLSMVDKGEQLLLELGFKQFRVRIHGDNIARIELLPEDFSKIMDETLRNRIYDSFKIYGFDYVALDLKGYRTGSMNEILKIE